MSKIFKKRGLALLSGVLALLAAAIVVTTLVNDPHQPDERPWSSWVQANLTRTVDVTVGSREVFEKAGWKYFGIFKGYKAKSYSIYEGLRTEYFDVFEEFKDVFNLKILYAVIAFLGVASLVLLVCAGLSFYNEFTKSSYVILGSTGLYILNGMAFFFIFLGVCLFAGLYHSQIRKNVLTESELADDFNSDGKSSLKFCFWIVVGSCFLPLINIALTFLNSARAKSYFNKNTTIPTTNVDGMMLY